MLEGKVSTRVSNYNDDNVNATGVSEHIVFPAHEKKHKFDWPV